MNRLLPSAILCLTFAIVATTMTSEAQARHPKGGYGHGYYAQGYPAGYRNAYYGHGYYYTHPFYSQGVLYNYYGGYRPSYSWGLYNGGSPEIYGQAVPYDYAPYKYKTETQIDAVYSDYGSTYGNFGYGDTGCRDCK